MMSLRCHLTINNVTVFIMLKSKREAAFQLCFVLSIDALTLK